MTTASIDAERQLLTLTWQDGETARFPFLWLRDNAPSSFHPVTQERVFDYTTLPDSIAPPEVQPNGRTIALVWPDGAKDDYDLDWLRTHRPGTHRPDPADVGRTAWRGGSTTVLRASAEDLLGSDAALLAWLKGMKAAGLSIIEGLADSTEAGMEVARRIGFLRETNFGTTFEVISKPNPNNLAYTSDALPLHTDLPNQEMPPGFQFLHCLANDAEGGGSVFADGLAIAEDILAEDPAAFETLTTVKIPYRFQDDAADIRTRQTVVVLDALGRISEVTYSPHIADILDLPADQMAAFYHAFRAFTLKARDPAYSVSLKLAPGEMVVFDNRRVLHGREAFDPSTGYRHLHGCYVDRVEFDSRIRVLSRSDAAGQE